MTPLKPGLFRIHWGRCSTLQRIVNPLKWTSHFLIASVDHVAGATMSLCTRLSLGSTLASSLVLEFRQLLKARAVTWVHICYVPFLSIGKSTWEQELATLGRFAMNAVTAEFEVHHHCQRLSVLKKEKHLSSSVEPNVEHCTLTNACMQSAGLAWNASQKDRASGASEHARVQRWVHNGLKREWLCFIDDDLRILPWQISRPHHGVAYSW